VTRCAQHRCVRINGANARAGRRQRQHERAATTRPGAARRTRGGWHLSTYVRAYAVKQRMRYGLTLLAALGGAGRHFCRLSSGQQRWNRLTPSCDSWTRA